MRFPAFLDTNVLFPAALVDTLLRLAELEVIRPRWSAEVLDELERNLGQRIGIDKAKRRRRRMEAAFPEAAVVGYEPLLPAMTNHPKDRHVLAAAAHSGCEVIVTFNGKDFPPDALAPHHIAAIHPDEFLLDQIDLYWQAVRRALIRQSAETARPHLTLLELTRHFENIGIGGFAAEVRRRWPREFDI